VCNVIFQIPYFRRSWWGPTAGLLLSMMLVATRVYAADVQDITVSASCSGNTDYSYAADTNDPNPTNAVLGQSGAKGGTVQWTFWDIGGCVKDTVNLKVAHCGALDITLPNVSGDVDPNATASADAKVTVTGHPTKSGEAKLTLKVTDTAPPNNGCTRLYNFHAIANGSGWGDPHMTTVDSVAYDFQGAGEFIALKGDKFEVQTRQRPVPTANPATDPHSLLNLCVSTYSAVAVRIGSNRVTLEPYVINGQPDPTTLQLWVNGNLVTNIPEGGYPLRAGGSSDPSALLEGRIVTSAAATSAVVTSAAKIGVYEFDTVDGTQLVATPAYWASQQTWYMDLRAYQTSADKGIWGRLAPGSWLPALSDGTSLPLPMPPMMQERYQALYDKFGNSWRVTDATSIFHYASGTNTATFTVADWPRYNPQSCTIQGQTPATPTTQQAAAQACSAIVNPAQKANCTFDVMVTGNLGFAQTYAIAEGFRPHGAGWQPSLPGTGTTARPGGPGKGGGGWTDWPWWLWILILILVLILIALFMRKKATP
jgi:hypothetical protein